MTWENSPFVAECYVTRKQENQGGKRRVSIFVPTTGQGRERLGMAEKGDQH